MIMGDFNARLQEAENEEEEHIFGKHTFAAGSPITWNIDIYKTNNRNKLLDICREHNLKVKKTHSSKQNNDELYTKRNFGVTKRR